MSSRSNYTANWSRKSTTLHLSSMVGTFPGETFSAENPIPRERCQKRVAGTCQKHLAPEAQQPQRDQGSQNPESIQTMDSLLCTAGIQVICLSVHISRTRAAAISPFWPWLTRPVGRTTRWKNGGGGLPSPLRAVCLPPCDLGGRQRGRGQCPQPRPCPHRLQQWRWGVCGKHSGGPMVGL